ncbi:hypothetical protein ACFOWU_05230 [Epilithonimonas zeae]|uniref:Uncharacterized protein n=1 Tax=Epilithonimonas zeae TaxID=1416779 RepID=A0A1N6F7F2_9FLAO|nr:hypothetical protein [Epilithonimonas zeae]SIN91201.1 hypothetical protein SAMN05444409_1102 [Epilithonimonas zeae]
MRFNILLYLFFILIINSCQSPKANAFRSTVVEKERIAFNIITSKNGTESQKLEYLVADDYKNALKAVDQQKKEFDQIILSLDSLETKDIKDASLLKNATVNYYTALRDLHYFDRKEILQRELIYNNHSNDKKSQQDELLNLYKQKKAYFNRVYKEESLLSDALQKFDISNGLR